MRAAGVEGPRHTRWGYPRLGSHPRPCFVLPPAPAAVFALSPPACALLPSAFAAVFAPPVRCLSPCLSVVCLPSSPPPLNAL